MTLEVMQPGMMLTVQDAGRLGLRHAGVSPAGPMDPPAFALANALVGNDAGAAGLEFAMAGGRFRSARALRFAVTGGDAEIRIDGRPVPSWQAHRLRPGETLEVGPLRAGVWGYLAVSGGIATEPVMGSRSTHLRTALGGLEGRTLRAGDLLPLGTDDPDAPCLGLPAGQVAPGSRSGPIRVVLGPQDEHFTAEALEHLATGRFVVTPQGDRMAMALEGPELEAARGHDIVSDGTVPGSIQVPGSRQPFVLMAESQTSGGYPKIATVTGADLPRLAQMRAGTALTFQCVSRDEAEELLLAERRRLAALIDALVPVAGIVLTAEYLLSCDLVGGIWPKDEVVR